MHLAEFPWCAACGGTEDVEVHHILPYHEYAGLELDLGNLISLCEKHGCHFAFGHLFRWTSHNPRVGRMARDMLHAVRSRPE